MLLASFTGLRVDVLIHSLLLVCVLADWIIQYTTRYKIVNTSDSVLLIPYTAILRPFIFSMRFESVGFALSTLIQTLFFGMDVLALFLSLVVISATMGVVLLRESYGDAGLFESVPSAVINVFIFLLTGENHPDIVYGPRRTSNIIFSEAKYVH